MPGWSLLIFIITFAYSSQEMAVSFDYSKSTEDNYAVENPTFVGKYRKLRRGLDYSYHMFYSETRQLLHDEIIDMFVNTKIEDGSSVCDRPTQNWLVFTAGCMGAGKGHVVRWLNNNGIFPLKSFVVVDPDAIREVLPETSTYNDRNPFTMGHLTQKEVGYISEVK